eukprot:198560-Rhodomonas_salina.1
MLVPVLTQVVPGRGRAVRDPDREHVGGEEWRHAIQGPLSLCLCVSLSLCVSVAVAVSVSVFLALAFCLCLFFRLSLSLFSRGCVTFHEGAGAMVLQAERGQATPTSRGRGGTWFLVVEFAVSDMHAGYPVLHVRYARRGYLLCDTWYGEIGYDPTHCW